MLSNSATCYVAMYVHCTVSLGRTSHGLPVRLKQKAPLGWQTEKHPPWFSLPPDLVGTEIEHISGFSDTDRWEGRVVIIPGDTVTADRLKLAPRAATTLSSYATRGRLPLYHKSTNCPDQLFVISCRFFVSIKNLDGWSLHEEKTSLPYLGILAWILETGQISIKYQRQQLQNSTTFLKVDWLLHWSFTLKNISNSLYFYS